MAVCGAGKAVGSIAGGGRAVIYQRIKVGVICLIEDFQIRQAGIQHTGSGLFGDAAYQRFAEFEVKLLVLMFFFTIALLLHFAFKTRKFAFGGAAALIVRQGQQVILIIHQGTDAVIVIRAINEPVGNKFFGNGKRNDMRRDTVEFDDGAAFGVLVGDDVGFKKLPVPAIGAGRVYQAIGNHHAGQRGFHLAQRFKTKLKRIAAHFGAVNGALTAEQVKPVELAFGFRRNVRINLKRHADGFFDKVAQKHPFALADGGEHGFVGTFKRFCHADVGAHLFPQRRRQGFVHFFKLFQQENFR